MATVKSPNLFRQWPVCWWCQKTTRSMCRSNLPAKKFVNMISLTREFWSNAANCSEIYVISSIKNRLSILTHHLHNTQTLEDQKYIVFYYVYIPKYHKIIQDTEIFSRIPKRVVILILMSQ